MFYRFVKIPETLCNAEEFSMINYYSLAPGKLVILNTLYPIPVVTYQHEIPMPFLKFIAALFFFQIFLTSRGLASFVSALNQ